NNILAHGCRLAATAAVAATADHKVSLQNLVARIVLPCTEELKIAVASLGRLESRIDENGADGIGVEAKLV
ncbi:hypothetical protein GW17_00055669, partial [Ensete ventricosum]